MSNGEIIPFFNLTNSTTTPDESLPVYLGFIAAMVSVLFFGTAFLPLKRFDPSDGIFYQWVLANGILVVGIVIHLIRGCPPFYPLTMLGGAIWALGNVCVVSIVKTIGMGVGFCLWSVSNILGGWASGRFGLFHTHARAPSNEVMNYSGVVLAAASAFIYTLIKPRMPDMELTISVPVEDDDTNPLLTESNGEVNNRRSSRISTYDQFQTTSRESRPCYENLPPMAKRFYGIFFALASGLMYGFSFTPSIYIQDNYPGASQNGLDYVLAQFTGTYLMALLVFLVYTIGYRNQPIINNQIVLPTLIGGVMWGIACSSWFIANQILSETISFPIICAGPTVVCNLCTVLIFKEITNRRDLMILGFGFSITITACVLTGLSI